VRSEYTVASEQLQELAPEQRGEVLGEWRPVVRRGDTHHRPDRRRALLDVHPGGRIDPGLSISRASSAPVEWPTMLTTPPLLEQTVDRLGEQRGAPGSADEGSVSTTRISRRAPRGPTSASSSRTWPK
jgi:hypothetical protein